VPFPQHSSKKDRVIAGSGVRLLRPWERQVSSRFSLVAAGDSMLKIVIVGAASLALVGTANAADLPHPQPVVQTGPVGKYPVGKTPVGKYPVGKGPAPLVTKG
jgi:hypothetical protein